MFELINKINMSARNGILKTSNIVMKQDGIIINENDENFYIKIVYTSL